MKENFTRGKPFLQRFFPLFFYLFLFISLVSLSACSGRGSGTGISLDAPVAELQGATDSTARVSGSAPGAPDGASLRAITLSAQDSQVSFLPIKSAYAQTELFTQDITIDNVTKVFDTLVCLEINQTLRVFVIDSNNNRISDILELTRDGTEEVCSVECIDLDPPTCS